MLVNTAIDNMYQYPEPVRVKIALANLERDNGPGIKSDVCDAGRIAGAD
jgi:hypothetical protein